MAKLLAFSTVVDRAGSSILGCFEERGEEEESLADDALCSLFIVDCCNN